jgi:hypothetical protein
MCHFLVLPTHTFSDLAIPRVKFASCQKPLTFRHSQTVHAVFEALEVQFPVDALSFRRSTITIAGDQAINPLTRFLFQNIFSPPRFSV